MEKLSKHDEARIMRAMEKTAELVKGGSSPSKAILQVVKSAEYGEFPPQMVQRIVEATNTAMQLAHMKTASGEARTESFPLADSKTIFEDLYPAKVEPPASKAAELAVPGDYSKRETADFMKAARQLPAHESPSPYGPDREIRAHRTMAIHNGLCKKAEAARSAYGRQREKVYMLAKSAAAYFKQTDHKPFAEVESRVLAEYGHIGKVAMDLVHQFTNGREKRAEADSVPRLYDRRIHPYDMFATLIEEAKTSVKLAEECEEAKSKKDKHESEFVSKFKPKKQIKPPKESVLDSAEPASSELKAAAEKEGKKGKDGKPWAVWVRGTAPSLDKELEGKEPESKAANAILGGSDSSFFNKAALDLGDLSSGLIESGTKALGFQEKKPIELGALQKVLDPEHEAEMRSIKTRAMLHEFMTSDPIISSYDADKVTNAFNQVSQLAPNVSQQPAVMRGIMRKILQQEGVLEPFETDQLTKLEKQLVPSIREMPAEAGFDIGKLG